MRAPPLTQWGRIVHEDITASPGDVARRVNDLHAAGSLVVHGGRKRQVRVADAFEGLPPPDEEASPGEAGDPPASPQLPQVVGVEVRREFERYGLLDERSGAAVARHRADLPLTSATRDRLGFAANPELL